VDALSKKVQVNLITVMSSYGIDLQDRILQATQWDEKYMMIIQRLQQRTSTSVGTSTGDRDANYCITADGLVRFRYMIYVSNCSELKKLILREFCAKPYLGHPGYHKALTMIKKFYYWSNLKKEVAEFVARFLDYQQVMAECKHPLGLLQPMEISKWKWEVISMDFITGLPRTVKQ